MRKCPLCGCANVVGTARRADLPVMQNVVFSDRAAALGAARAEFELGVCGDCGFAFNSRFDSSLMVYDERYDNDVPSRAFEHYYREVAEALDRRHRLRAALVCDIGCGKGRFLEVACDAVPELRGLGIDPSCVPRAATAASPIRLVRDEFKAEQLEGSPALVVCRHVLEHIAAPNAFLSEIHRGLSGHPDIPVFFEVPDLDWILDNGAFWDLCYEHCNYFTSESLTYALSCAGFEVEEVSRAFGGQYLWAHARRRAGPLDARTDASRAVGRAERYTTLETTKIADARARASLAAAGDGCAIWGMATKGVIFACIVDRGAKLLPFGVDINPKKQGRYAPVTGLPIVAPEALRSLKNSRPTIFVMNPNYLGEIRSECAALDLAPDFVAI